MIDRRTILSAAAGIGALTAVSRNAFAVESPPPAPHAAGNKPVLAMLAYPGMFPLDLVGPESIFSAMGTHRVELVWKTLDIVREGSGLGIAPTMTFAAAPREVDILFVPGGALGTLRCMEDSDVLGFLASRAPAARYVTSVCTGSLVLAAAGVLKGYRATSHWAVRDRLADLGSIPVHERVVEDRNRVTGAGVSAGIDMALTLAAKLVGAQRAKAAQLNIEYDPRPPFNAGSPEGAGPEVTAAMTDAYKPFLDQLNVVAPRVRGRLGLA